MAANAVRRPMPGAGRITAAIVAAAALALPCQAGESGAQPAYHLAARYPIGGAELRYDYLRVDSAGRRLYVAHGSRVEVLDADSGRQIGQVPGIAVAHGIEIVQSLHAAFATSGDDRTLVMFDPATLQVIRRIKYLGAKPDALQFDAASGLLFVVNGGATGDVSVVDPATGAIVDDIDLAGGKLEEIALDGHGRGFVNDEQQSVIHVFDTRTRKRLADWLLAPALCGLRQRPAGDRGCRHGQDAGNRGYRSRAGRRSLRSEVRTRLHLQSRRHDDRARGAFCRRLCGRADGADGTGCAHPCPG
jgi:hypothetical protein